MKKKSEQSDAEDENEEKIRPNGWWHLQKLWQTLAFSQISDGKSIMALMNYCANDDIKQIKKEMKDEFTKIEEKMNSINSKKQSIVTRSPLDTQIIEKQDRNSNNKSIIQNTEQIKGQVSDFLKNKIAQQKQLIDQSFDSNLKIKKKEVCNQEITKSPEKSQKITPQLQQQSVSQNQEQIQSQEKPLENPSIDPLQILKTPTLDIPVEKKKSIMKKKILIVEKSKQKQSIVLEEPQSKSKSKQKQKYPKNPEKLKRPSINIQDDKEEILLNVETYPPNVESFIQREVTIQDVVESESSQSETETIPIQQKEQLNENKIIQSERYVKDAVHQQAGPIFIMGGGSKMNFMKGFKGHGGSKNLDKYFRRAIKSHFKFSKKVKTVQEQLELIKDIIVPEEIKDILLNQFELDPKFKKMSREIDNKISVHQNKMILEMKPLQLQLDNISPNKKLLFQDAVQKVQWLEVQKNMNLTKSKAIIEARPIFNEGDFKPPKKIFQQDQIDWIQRIVDKSLDWFHYLSKVTLEQKIIQIRDIQKEQLKDLQNFTFNNIQQLQKISSENTKKLNTNIEQCQNLKQEIDQILLDFRHDHQELLKFKQRLQVDVKIEMEKIKNQLDQLTYYFIQLQKKVQFSHETIQSTIDATLVGNLIAQQDEADRKNLAVFGTQNNLEMINSLVLPTQNEENKIEKNNTVCRFPTDKKEKYENLLSIDAGKGILLQEATFAANNFLKQIKGACLGYKATPITYNGQKFLHSELLNIQTQLLQKAKFNIGNFTQDNVPTNDADKGLSSSISIPALNKFAEMKIKNQKQKNNEVFDKIIEGKHSKIIHQPSEKKYLSKYKKRDNCGYCQKPIKSLNGSSNPSAFEEEQICSCKIFNKSRTQTRFKSGQQRSIFKDPQNLTTQDSPIMLKTINMNSQTGGDFIHFRNLSSQIIDVPEQSRIHESNSSTTKLVTRFQTMDKNSSMHEDIYVSAAMISLIQDQNIKDDATNNLSKIKNNIQKRRNSKRFHSSLANYEIDKQAQVDNYLSKNTQNLFIKQGLSCLQRGRSAMNHNRKQKNNDLNQTLIPS